MGEVIAFPFLRAREESVNAESWHLHDEDQTSTLGDLVHHWDYSRNLVLSRGLAIDPARLARDCGFSGKFKVSLSVVLATGEIALREQVWNHELDLSDDDGQFEQEIRIELPGSRLQGHLELVTELTFLGADSGSPLSPSAKGSRLWEDQCFAKLEGGSGRLPMEAADFSSIDARMAMSPWRIHAETADLDVSFLGHVHVGLNSHRKDIVNSIRAGDSAVLERLAVDLVRHLMDRALDQEDFSGVSDDYEAGSIGHTVATWIETAFAGIGIRGVLSMKKHDPARYEAIIASTFGGHYGS